MKHSFKTYRRIALEHKMELVLVSLFVGIIALTVFQDFLHAQRQNSAFYFFESLVFKGFWLLFPPLLLLLKKLKKSHRLAGLKKMALLWLGVCISHLLLTPIAVIGLCAVFLDYSYSIHKILSFTLSNHLMTLLTVYGVYISWLFYRTHRSESPPQASTVSYITVTQGKSGRPVAIDKIFCIRAESPYVTIQLAEQQLLHSATLKSMLSSLDKRFVRVHKSHIVNTDKVLSWHSRLNGDYDLTLLNGYTLRLSRNYVSDFKSKFSTPPPLTALTPQDSQ